VAASATQPLGQDEVDQAVKAATTPAARLVLVLAAMHAARRKAIRELRLDDVDPGNRRLTIAGRVRPIDKFTRQIGLQEYYSDGSWRTMATGSAYVYPGGGSSNWANARHICESVVVAGWRSYVIVNIGNGASANTAAQNLACRTLT
jgi:hypothetical protein